MSAVGDRHQPGGAVEGGTVVVAGALLGFAGVQGRADAQLPGLDLIPGRGHQSLLRGQRGGDTAQAGLERGMEAVARVLDDRSAVLLDGLPHDFIVAGQGGLHLCGMFLPQPGAAFNICE